MDVDFIRNADVDGFDGPARSNGPIPALGCVHLSIQLCVGTDCVTGDESLRN